MERDGKQLGPYRFSSENQPSAEAKSRGHQKSFRSALLVRAVLEKKVITGKGSRKFAKIRKQAAAWFQIEESEIDFEVLMIYVMVERAIELRDVQAFNAVMDRAYGKPLLRINEEWTPPETSTLILPNGDRISL
jgi:hypothetical protein